MIKTMKTMRVRWLLLVIFVVQFHIWVLPYVFKDAPKTERTANRVMEMGLDDREPPVYTPEENLFEEMNPLEATDKVIMTPERSSSVETEDKPTLNTDQPTPLIYADWFLINWQAILTILTILPVVITRWRDVLGGKQTKSAE